MYAEERTDGAVPHMSRFVGVGPQPAGFFVLILRCRLLYLCSCPSLNFLGAGAGTSSSLGDWTWSSMARANVYGANEHRRVYAASWIPSCWGEDMEGSREAVAKDVEMETETSNNPTRIRKG